MYMFGSGWGWGEWVRGLGFTNPGESGICVCVLVAEGREGWC